MKAKVRKPTARERVVAEQLHRIRCNKDHEGNGAPGPFCNWYYRGWNGITLIQKHSDGFADVSGAKVVHLREAQALLEKFSSARGMVVAVLKAI